ncbi:conserved hypothetical protein [Culex quinquefasciatus]|uniref:LIM zinc-binding domain-containing protein n=1 Tax=Culex quinquefasciatus TaxID=7176 RepID=B0WQ56_CULQU|nr:conserved hypothetical protein [Culex quinquefasciatus]|eukprot:XP_001850840.1 conserved hypothetical protein [Culex quinquefasciatus]
MDLSYKDKHWHEACFLCNKCRISLVDKQFGSKADKIYCGNCYDAQFASRCDGCGEIFRAGPLSFRASANGANQDKIPGPGTSVFSICYTVLLFGASKIKPKIRAAAFFSVPNTAYTSLKPEVIICAEHEFRGYQRKKLALNRKQTLAPPAFVSPTFNVKYECLEYCADTANFVRRDATQRVRNASWSSDFEILLSSALSFVNSRHYGSANVKPKLRHKITQHDRDRRGERQRGQTVESHFAYFHADWRPRHSPPKSMSTCQRPKVQSRRALSLIDVACILKYGDFC